MARIAIIVIAIGVFSVGVMVGVSVEEQRTAQASQLEIVPSGGDQFVSAEDEMLRLGSGIHDIRQAAHKANMAMDEFRATVARVEKLVREVENGTRGITVEMKGAIRLEQAKK